MYFYMHGCNMCMCSYIYVCLYKDSSVSAYIHAKMYTLKWHICIQTYMYAYRYITIVHVFNLCFNLHLCPYT